MMSGFDRHAAVSFKRNTSGWNSNCPVGLAACNGVMYLNRDQTATIPLGTVSPRAQPARPEAQAAQLGRGGPRLRCLGCGWEAAAARQQVALEPGMLRTVLPWILAPWAVLALVVWLF